ncbi:hypothetical protein CDAR_78421 [Caerostris darwini]|uniref:Uncharacterized protein n=1 Tax=Caerostris darwini TaxID=1538125 RepID=A0AAV4SG78_9ARAC|nr:hypothetical protein CDAR_78421 [Caerostris darwini]
MENAIVYKTKNCGGRLICPQTRDEERVLPQSGLDRCGSKTNRLQTIIALPQNILLLRVPKRKEGGGIEITSANHSISNGIGEDIRPMDLIRIVECHLSAFEQSYFHSKEEFRCKSKTLSPFLETEGNATSTHNRLAIFLLWLTALN